MSDGFHDNAIPVSELYKHWGFSPAVFDADEARKEQRLDEVFQRPAWFFDVLGNINDQDFVVVVGVRGAGKSALRRCIAEYCESGIGSEVLEGRVLCIEIDHDVPNWVKVSVDSGNAIEAFTAEVCDRLALGIVTFVGKEIVGKLDGAERAQFRRYLSRLRKRRPEEVEKLIGKTLSTGKRLYKKIKGSEIVRDIVEVGSTVAGAKLPATKIEESGDVDVTGGFSVG